MAVYSTNQNRQLYVVKNIVEGTPKNVGELSKVQIDAEGGKYFTYMGFGGLTRTDIIGNIMWVTATTPEQTAYKLKGYTLKLDQNVNNGKPISGQDYIVRVNFRQMYGMSDEDIYQKYGAVHATAAMSENPGLFYKELAYSLFKNFNRLYSPLISILIKNTLITRATKVNGTVKLYGPNSTGEIEEITVTEGYTDGISFFEYPQTDEWARGTKPYTPVYFEVIPTTVFDADKNEVTWGTVEPIASDATIPNGYKYADLEYFCMGERGDQYRNVGWPNAIQTKYMITDPESEWYCIDVHYAYQGTCEDIQKSEKTITFLTGASDFDTLRKSFLQNQETSNTPPSGE